MQVFRVALDIMDRPWDWGAADCCTAACDVFARLHGIDPMLPLRGRYSTRMGALRHIACWGGWLAMGSKLATQSGLVRVSIGMPGDIGIIRDAKGVLALGIRTEMGWAGKTDTGLAIVPQVVRVWRAV